MINDPPIHPARQLSYGELIEGLRRAEVARFVRRVALGDHSIWCYTPVTVYERAWDEITTLARGLILDERNECVVATPFPKFFNLGERPTEMLPGGSFEVFEKLDGSLIIIWHDGKRWRTATKGSLNSIQAGAAEALLGVQDLSVLSPGHTYLAEYVGPSNRIVVPYEREELVLLAAYDDAGHEWAYPLVEHIGASLGWRVAARHDFASLAALVEHAGALPATEEGFVLRFHDSTRLKVKGDEYRRIHALISRCTPLAMWEAMLAGDNLTMVRDQLPDEFLGDFDEIVGTLQDNLDRLATRVRDEAETVAHLSDKEVGLRLDEWPEDVRRFIFPYRKNGGDLLSGKTRQALFSAIRPKGNVLPGYTPSYAINRVVEESL